MHADGDAVGVLVCEHGMRAGSRIERRVVSMLERYAAHTAHALHNAWLVEQLERSATTDALTGVANRRTFDAELARELARSARTEEPVTLLLLDADHFKRINDTLGHLAGDRVLKAIATALHGECRAGDTFARYGGEEFAAILPGSTAKRRPRRRRAHAPRRQRAAARDAGDAERRHRLLPRQRAGSAVADRRRRRRPLRREGRWTRPLRHRRARAHHNSRLNRQRQLPIKTPRPPMRNDNMHHARTTAGPRLARKVLGTVLVTGLLASLAGFATWSAFSATSTNPTNQFAAGTVAISDNDAGSAMFNLSGMDPTDPAEQRCIVLTYTGSLASTVRLYGTTGGSGLADYLNVKVTRGTICRRRASPPAPASPPTPPTIAASAPASCTTARSRASPTTTRRASSTPVAATPESWTTGEVHAYRFEVTLTDDDAAQGLDATQSFTWEARNS